MQIAILEPDGFSKKALARLGVLGPVSCYEGGSVSEFLAEVNVLFVRLAHKLDDNMLASAPKLKLLVSPTTGHNHIDLDALNRRGIRLLSLKGESEFLESIRATPEHTLGLLIALLRNYSGAFLSPTRNAWDRDRFRGEEIARMNVGIIGYGRVGRRVAHYLRALDADVRWFDPNPVSGLGDPGREAKLEQLIRWSRAVILCAAHDRSMSAILSGDRIALLEGRYLVNTARGELIDEEALLDAIFDGRLAGVAVDVISNETGANQLSRWIGLSETHNVIVTPHIGGATRTSMLATEEFMTERLIDFIQHSGGDTRDPRSLYTC